MVSRRPQVGEMDGLGGGFQSMTSYKMSISRLMHVNSRFYTIMEKKGLPFDDVAQFDFLRAACKGPQLGPC